MLCPWVSNSILPNSYSNAMERKRKNNHLSSLSWSQPGLGRGRNSCKHTEQTLSCDQPGETEAPAHDTQTGTHSLHQTEPACRTQGKSLKKPPDRPRWSWSPVPRGTPAGRSPCLLSGIHPDSRILTEGLSELGIVHSKSRHRQHSLKRSC